MSELSGGNILHLSPELRRRIYLFTGVAPRRRDQKFIFDLHGAPHGEQADGSELHPQFHGLLLSCRAIYQEAAALLYSSNSFVIYSATGPFDPLLALTPTALTSLEHLKMVVSSQTTCHFKARRRRSHSAAAHLSKITPGRLALFLMCDVYYQDDEAARLALAPLSLLPPLKEYHVRIGEKPIPHLQKLVREAVIKALGGVPTGPTVTPPFSRFLRLPRELRLRILSFTDLVTPIKQVSWDRGGAYMADREGYPFPHEVGFNSGSSLAACRRDHHHGCQFGNCFVRSFSENHLAGCFCTVNHTAVSSTCPCWAPPTYLFLVCRTLYPEVQHVFFSANRFIVHDFGHPDPPGRDPRTRRPQLINAPSLTVRVVVAHYMYHHEPDEPTATASMQQNVQQQVEATYNQILSPLARLARDSTCTRGPLRRFYAHLTCPWWVCGMLGYRVGAKFTKWRRFAKREEKRIKEQAERTVLGGERYEKQRSSVRRIEESKKDGEDEEDDGADFGFQHEFSKEILTKSLEDWDGEQKEGREPPISHWLFHQIKIRNNY
ncbi:hypothetical protein QBC44DRAFT_392996 [Cladorrhinum sp. PSN332]|nr:hypothetical protein QBC44DRAFT_392996 [Cladorrhinum sp. PSN332]